MKPLIITCGETAVPPAVTLALRKDTAALITYAEVECTARAAEERLSEFARDSFPSEGPLD